MFSEESSDEEKIAVTSRSRSRFWHAISAAAASILIAARAPSPSGRSVARCITSTRACNQCQPGHSTAASAGGLDLGPANSKHHALPISSGRTQQCACVLSPGAGVGQKLPRRGRTSEKKPRLGQLHVGSASGKWLEVLLDIMKRLGHESCTSLQRPLILHTMHTGTGSFRMFCDMAGIQVHDISGAEKKPHAREFARLNNVAPRDFFRQSRDASRGTRGCGSRVRQSGHLPFWISVPALQQNVTPGSQNHATILCTRSLRWCARTSTRRSRRRAC